jgi:hypothetical protein
MWRESSGAEAGASVPCSLIEHVPFIGGILSFCHSHLVDFSSSKILPGSHGNRVGTSVGRLVCCRCLLGLSMSFGTHMSIVSLLSTIETSPLS